MKTSTLLHALSISRGVHAVLSRPRTGHVLANFTRSCYLDLEGQIIAVVASDLLNGPLNIVVDAAAWHNRVDSGAPAVSASGVVRIDPVEIDLTGAVVWDAALPPWPAEQGNTLRDHLPMLRRLLEAEAPEGGLARAVTGREARTPLETRAVPAISDMGRGLRSRDALLASRCAAALAGLGPGLTPSGDDVLVGCLLAFAVLPADGADTLRRAIVSAAGGRTTRISAAYLDAAARGEASEAWHQLLAALAVNDAGRIASATRGVMTFGETSGSDMLAGFVLATEALPCLPPLIERSADHPRR